MSADPPVPLAMAPDGRGFPLVGLRGGPFEGLEAEWPEGEAVVGVTSWDGEEVFVGKADLSGFYRRSGEGEAIFEVQATPAEHPFRDR